MCAPQNVTRRIDDLVQSNHVNHSIPNGPHVHPLTTSRFSTKTYVYINPYSALFSSPYHILTVPSAFSKIPRCRLACSSWRWELPHFQNPCWLRDSKYFRKTVASAAMVFGPGAGVWVFPKTIFAKADVSFFSLEKTVHVGSMLCLALRIGHISKKPRRWSHVFFWL
jgi:hypothetical protein